jgi:hypothetical protein
LHHDKRGAWLRHTNPKACDLIHERYNLLILRSIPDLGYILKVNIFRLQDRGPLRFTMFYRYGRKDGKMYSRM